MFFRAGHTTISLRGARCLRQRCVVASVLLMLLCLSVGGCSAPWLIPFGPRHASVPSNQGLENPMFVQVPDAEFVFNQVVDEVDDYFRIEREQRVHEAGGVLMEGRVDTYPATGSTILEPWRRDSTPGFEKWHSTFQSTRRRAAVRVIPRQGGFLIEVNVIKELEDVSHPERSSTGSATIRHDGSLVRNETDAPQGSATLGWITLGRDIALEQQMLAELRARLQNVTPPKHSPKFAR